VKRSETLHGYSVFVDLVRSNEASGHSLEEAMELAIDWCINHRVLSDFLRANASEVKNMLFAKWNLEDAKVVWRAEAREEGLEEGLK
jgi:hypothetical protein